MIRRIIFIKLDRTARVLTGFRKWPPIYLDLPCIRLDLSYVSSGAPYIIFTTNYEKVGSTRQTKPGDLPPTYMVPEWLVGLTVSCTAAAILHNKL